MLYLLFYILQTGNDKYKLAATSEDGVKKPKKGKKNKKDLDELKKEVELVRNYQHSCLFYFLNYPLDLRSISLEHWTVYIFIWLFVFMIILSERKQLTTQS